MDTPATPAPTSAPAPARGRALLLEKIHPEAARRLTEAGYAVTQMSGALEGPALAEALDGVTLLGIRSKSLVTREVLEQASALDVVGAFCIGTNQIDLDACLDHGIPVFNAPYANTRSVVELALGQMIVLMRDVPEKSALLHAGEWRKSAPRAREIRGKRLGIVGYGNIGAQLSVLAEAMGMQVGFHDITEKLVLGNARPFRSLHDLLGWADVISVHVDGAPENHGMFDAAAFHAMRPGAVFINLSRGFVVDLEALKDALQSGRVRSAAVDVFPEEPIRDGDPFDSPLRGLANVLLTPHIGGSTEEAQENIARFVPEKMLSYLEQGATSLSVNFPNLQLPELRGAHRVVHIHDNVPGVLARINRIMADRDINIVGQYLKTNERIGYVITDVARDWDRGLLEELRTISGTTRVRALS
jgi:D-3-phosphoglycerate dehydrogenase / 2-oxoglutarate reductase